MVFSTLPLHIVMADAGNLSNLFPSYWWWQAQIIWLDWLTIIDYVYNITGRVYYIVLSTEWCWATMLATEHNDVMAQHNVGNSTQWQGGTAQWWLLLATIYNVLWWVTMAQLSGSWCIINWSVTCNSFLWLACRYLALNCSLVEMITKLQHVGVSELAWSSPRWLCWVSTRQEDVRISRCINTAYIL